MGLYIYDTERVGGPIDSTGTAPYVIHPSFFKELDPSPLGPALSLVKITLVAMGGGIEANFFTGNGYFRIVWAGQLEPVYQVSPIHWELLASGGTLTDLQDNLLVDEDISGPKFTELGYKWVNSINNTVYGIDFKVFYQHSAYIQT
jgi:hypothetical protein